MTPLVLALRNGFKGDEKIVVAAAQRYGMTLEQAREALQREINAEEIWVNEKYQVAVRRFEHRFFGRCMQINIRRRDGKVIFRDWRDFQQIKNQLADPEFEAIEIYPAESRLVDSSNKYHLWVVLDPEFRWPFGWDQRDVQDTRPNDTLPGHKQRKLPKGWEESDPKALYLRTRG